MTGASDRRVKIIRLMPVLDFGGVESRIVLQSQMIDRERFDYRVCAFWSPGEAAKNIRANGVEVDILGVDPAVRNPGAALALMRYLREQSPDILHASISEANFHGAIAGALTGVPVRIVEEVGIPSRGRLGEMVFGWMYGLAHQVVGVSKATCDVLKREGAAEEKVRLIYNCANPSFFDGEMVRRDGDGPVDFLAVGRLVPVKNHGNLLRAFRGVVDELDDVRLRIAGEGPLRDEMEAQIQALELEDHVELLGFRDDVKDLLRQSDVFLLPSWSEGCSISLVEALSSGIVPLGSTADGIGEVMGELGDAHQIAPDDVDGWTKAMVRCAVMGSERRYQVGQAARKIAFERFSPMVYNANVTAMYEEMVAEQLSIGSSKSV